jgi:hypothetical protein
MVDWWLRTHKVVAKARRKAFDSLVCLVAWSLWLERNCMFFDQKSSSAIPNLLYP